MSLTKKSRVNIIIFLCFIITSSVFFWEKNIFAGIATLGIGALFATIYEYFDN
ncbi:MAG: hypothetical protein ACRCX8_16080 [Sarcina sp.]